jgi:hypothetical protein
MPASEPSDGGFLGKKSTAVPAKASTTASRNRKGNGVWPALMGSGKMSESEIPEAINRPQRAEWMD